MPVRLFSSLSILPSRAFSAALLVVLLFASKDSSAAQDASPERDLRSMRLQLRQDLVGAILPEKRTQRDEMSALEKKLASAQDFAGAIRARDERLKLEKEIATLEKELPALKAQALSLLAKALPDRIEFKLSDAVLNGLTLDAKGAVLSGFSSPGASATWKLPDLPPGGYEVLLRYTADDGEVVLQESFYSLSAICRPPLKQAEEKSLGTLRIRDGSGILTLKAKAPEKSASLRVYGLVLMPAAR